MPNQPQEEVVTSYKAFNADLTCTDGDTPFTGGFVSSLKPDLRV